MKTACVVNNETKEVVNRVSYDETLPADKQWFPPENHSVVFDETGTVHIFDTFDESKGVFNREIEGEDPLEVSYKIEVGTQE